MVWGKIGPIPDVKYLLFLLVFSTDNPNSAAALAGSFGGPVLAASIEELDGVGRWTWIFIIGLASCKVS